MANKRILGIKKHSLDIVKSVTKRVFKVDETKANQRAHICSTCISSVPDQVFGGNMCNECWCNLKTLVYSTDKGCELNKW